MTDHTPEGNRSAGRTARLRDLVEASSLGTPEAKALRESVTDEQAAKAVARAKTLRGGGLTLTGYWPSQAIRGARELDLSKAYGRGVGLSDEATAEVIDTWLAWYRQTPKRVNWTTIRDMLAKRANGGDWRPRGSISRG